MMEAKKHFKLFKKGKQWCCMAIATMTVALGVAAFNHGCCFHKHGSSK